MLDRIIETAIERVRLTLLIFFAFMLAGVIAYLETPKEAEPDIPIQVLVVNATYSGVSTEDSESLIVEPLENELLDVNGIKELTSYARANGADINIEFEADVDKKVALAEVRDAVSKAKAKLPGDMDEPLVKEVTMADTAPVVNLMLHGDVSEKVMLRTAKALQSVIEENSAILEVEIVGERDEVIEVLITPKSLETYGLSLPQVFQIFKANDKLITAGTLENGKGAYSLKVPGKIDSLYKLMKAPIKVADGQVVLFEEVATVQPNLKKQSSLARLNGQPAIALLVKKKSGENIIETVDYVSAVVEKAKEQFPQGLEATLIDDKSTRVKQQVYDLENSVLFSVILVLIVVIAFLGVRSALLVGFAIPAAFLIGILLLSIGTASINMVTLFGLIMSVGMLVDGAIVVNEYADKKMSDGATPKEAYTESAQKMALPIIASTLTTLASFSVLAFIPGMVGKFLMYLPLTALMVLVSSLFVSLLLIPALGARLAKPRVLNNKQKEHYAALESGEFEKLHGIEKQYANLIRKAVQFPKSTVFAIVLVSITLLKGYTGSHPAVEFFTNVEPEGITLVVKQKGDLSLSEKDAIVREVETLIAPYHAEFDEVYTEVKGNNTIGKVRMILGEWNERRKASEITEEIRSQLSSIQGAIVEVAKEKKGPSQGKDLQLVLSGHSLDELKSATRDLEAIFNQTGYLVDVENNIAENGLEWRYEVNREHTAEYGVDLQTIGSMMRLMNEGVEITRFTPDGSPDELDVVVKLPQRYRHPDTLSQLSIMTAQGAVPFDYFVTPHAEVKMTSIIRIDGQPSLKLMANLKEGVVMSDVMPEMTTIVSEFVDSNKGITAVFKGDQEQQAETAAFMMKAFAVAIAVMFVILVAQFNSFRQSVLILSAIFFATIGSLTGYDRFNIPFSVVMSGIGVISLAGIIINNNIILVETFNVYKRQNLPLGVSVLRAAVSRFRPVLMTTITTILGLLPMALLLSIDVIQGSYTIGAPAAQWWYQLSSAVIGGLTFGTVITLLLTPSLLMVIYSGVFPTNIFIKIKNKLKFNK